MNNHAYAKHNILNGRVVYRAISKLDKRTQAYIDAQIAVCKAELLDGGLLEADIVTGVESQSVAEVWVSDYDEAQIIPLDKWKKDMLKTDKYDPVTGFEGMDRVMEKHIRDDHGGITGTPARQAEYDAKVLLRSNKPL